MVAGAADGGRRAEQGDLEALEQLLADDVVVYRDGGGKAVAARHPVVGAGRVARFMAHVAQHRREIGNPDKLGHV
jgi:RNA polymerase sigma-70 factor (ECF subfamily)